jgi:hypothetical protein
VIDTKLFLNLAAAPGFAYSVHNYADNASRMLHPWRPEMLDMPNLAYGTGKSTFAICPHGTTLLDARTREDHTEFSCAHKHKENVRPGQWIASFIPR